MACNGILGNTASSGTDDHLFDPTGADAANDGASEADTADGASLADAGSDGSVPDAAKIACGTSILVNTCLDCPGKLMLCAGACVASCHGGCGGSPIECIACNEAGAPVVATCETVADAAACLTGNERCLCPAGVVDCPGNNLICAGGSCYACGEPSTDTASCRKAGDNCDTQVGGDRYTCH